MAHTAFAVAGARFTAPTPLVELRAAATLPGTYCFVHSRRIGTRVAEARLYGESICAFQATHSSGGDSQTCQIGSHTAGRRLGGTSQRQGPEWRPRPGPHSLARCRGSPSFGATNGALLSWSPTHLRPEPSPRSPRENRSLLTSPPNIASPRHPHDLSSSIPHVADANAEQTCAAL